jgi:hypothetical protein
MAGPNGRNGLTPRLPDGPCTPASSPVPAIRPTAAIRPKHAFIEAPANRREGRTLAVPGAMLKGGVLPNPAFHASQVTAESRGPLPRRPLIVWTTQKTLPDDARHAAAAAFLAGRLAPAFLGAVFAPTLRPSPSDFARSDRRAA